MSLLKYFIKHPECAYKIKDTSKVLLNFNMVPRKVKYAYLLGYDCKKSGKVAIITFYHKEVGKYVCANTTLNNLVSIDSKRIKNKSILERISLLKSYNEFINGLDMRFYFSIDCYKRGDYYLVCFPACCRKYLGDEYYNRKNYFPDDLDV